MVSPAVALEVPDPQTLAALVSLPLGFSIFIYVKGVLNAWGAAAAFLLGLVIIWATDLRWLLVLLAMLGLASFATRYRYHDKAQRGVQEGAGSGGDGGRRKTANVLYNGVVPLAIAATLTVAPWTLPAAAILYISAIAVVASDTLASEIGSLARRTVLITRPWKRVPSGTNGGISPVGQVAALLGGLAVGVVGAVARLDLPQGAWSLALAFDVAAEPWLIAVPALAGFVGCQVDSVMGATLESRDLLNKGEVNLLSTLVGALFALVLWAAVAPGGEVFR